MARSAQRRARAAAQKRRQRVQQEMGAPPRAPPAPQGEQCRSAAAGGPAHQLWKAGLAAVLQEHCTKRQQPLHRSSQEPARVPLPQTNRLRDPMSSPGSPGLALAALHVRGAVWLPVCLD